MLKNLPDIFRINFDYSQITKELLENANAKTIVPIKCLTCNKIFKRELSKHFAGKRGCNFCYKSNFSKMVSNCLDKIGIEFEDEIKIKGPNGTTYRYDYKFNYNGNIFILEPDGKAHFELIDPWHKNKEYFETCRDRDIYKQYRALKNGYKIIRIDYKISIENIENHIRKALDLQLDCYYSNPDMYTWLTDGVNNYKE